MPAVRVEYAAAQELEEAAAWYESESPGTGVRLLDAFDGALRVLREDPVPLTRAPGRAGQLGAMQLLLHRFPYSLIVVDDSDTLVVVAVAHQSRRPGYWLGRLST